MALDWKRVRPLFALDPDVTEFSAMLLASNPEPVRRAIHKYRVEIDRSPNRYCAEYEADNVVAAFQAVERYFGVPRPRVAYTHSTTMALAQIYGGIRIAPGDEILTSRNEHFTTLEALRLRARRDGTRFRQVPLFSDSRTATDDEIVANLRRQIAPWTRVLALTWVYSSDGVKLPIRRIAGVVAEENEKRSADKDRLLFVVDGVHGFGIENATFDDLGCDIFAAGCHKWIFGPRGTAILAATEAAWRQMVPIVPSFALVSDGVGQTHIPGGVLAFEHFWTLKEAFGFLWGLGKADVQDYVHGLCTRLKRGLAGDDRIDVRTPASPAQSSGIVCLDIAGQPPEAVVERLFQDYDISAMMSSFDITSGRLHVRLSPAIYNNATEVDAAIRALKALAHGTAFRRRAKTHAPRPAARRRRPKSAAKRDRTR